MIGNMTIQSIYNITWYKNDRLLINDSQFNIGVKVSADHRSIVITDTWRGTPGLYGTRGIYYCQVCTVDGTCLTRHSMLDVCGKFHLIM